jgi:hypothetical protein
MSGWIKLHRGWSKSPDFASEPFTEREAWLWLIEAAAYEAHTRYVKGHAISLKRGEILVSQRTLADEWKWGRQRVRGFITKLELLGSVKQAATHGLTHISVCNYTKYQDQQPSAQPIDAATSQQPTLQPTLQPSSNPAATQLSVGNCVEISERQPSSNPAATQPATQTATHEQPIKEEGKEDKEDMPTQKSVAVASIFTASEPGGDKAFWDKAVSYIGGEKKRSLVGKWLKENDRAVLVQAITASQLEGAVDPIAYINGVLRKNRGRVNGRPLGSGFSGTVDAQGLTYGPC